MAGRGRSAFGQSKFTKTAILCPFVIGFLSFLGDLGGGVGFFRPERRGEELVFWLVRGERGERDLEEEWAGEMRRVLLLVVWERPREGDLERGEERSGSSFCLGKMKAEEGGRVAFRPSVPFFNSREFWWRVPRRLLVEGASMLATVLVRSRESWLGTTGEGPKPKEEGDLEGREFWGEEGVSLWWGWCSSIISRGMRAKALSVLKNSSRGSGWSGSRR